jgi:phosphoribosylformimino-5-aminoimidazole carboxamide ribotide isomerase
MLKGANIEAMKQMAEALTVPVIASGGVTSLDDVKALADIESIGIEAAILGKALYTGHIDFSQALKITQG